MSLMTEVGAQLSANLPSFVTVKAAWTSTPVADFDAELPAALYYLAGFESEASPFANDTLQPGDISVGVLVVCPVGNLEALLEELRGTLAGFEPTGDANDVYEAFEHVRGESLDINASVVWWLDLYAVRNYRQ